MVENNECVRKVSMSDPIPLRGEVTLLPPSTVSPRKNQTFREFCSGSARKYKRNGDWSDFEIDVNETLTTLGLVENVDYWHNYKLQNSTQSGYYSLDFFFPRLRLVVECDGSIFHGMMGDKDLKDAVRDNWLKKLGYTVLRLKDTSEASILKLEAVLNG